MPVLGEKTSYVLSFLSAWGFLQLAATGVCLHLRSPAFAEDVPLAADNQADYGKRVDLGYARGALNCWVAALLYVVTGCAAGLNLWQVKRVKEVRAQQFY